MTKITQDILLASAYLSENLPVAVPTETVYGLAANAYSELAIKRVFEAKNRPAENPLIIHISRMEELNEWVEEVPEIAKKLIARFWPGPLTLVLPKKRHVSPLITGGLDTVAIRMPNHPVLRELFHSLQFPLVAPSANAFMHISPTCVEHVYESLAGRIPLILDGGPCQVGIESTIVAFEDDVPVILRHGAISVELIVNYAAKVNVKTSPTSTLRAPGMHVKHYAPKTACYSVTSISSLSLPAQKRIGLISFYPLAVNQSLFINIALTQEGDLKEAAKNLYAALYQLDQLDLDFILIELVPEEHEGRALNDRIMRASQPISNLKLDS